MLRFPPDITKLHVAILQFTHMEWTKPADVINDLHNRIARPAGLNVLGAWPKFLNPFNWRNYELGTNVFFHPSAATFGREYFAGIATHRPTPTQRLAWRGTGTFTFTECMREMQPTGSDFWIFDVLRRHGMRDGLYCPTNGWMVVYWSPKKLVINEHLRNALCFAAGQAAAALNQIVSKGKRAGVVERMQLSKREYDVLYGLSLGERPADIARRLGLATKTVRHFIAIAQRKLGAKTPTQAVAEAYRRALVK
jgi:DNA-binding CsgD family transcriptional regulator